MKLPGVFPITILCCLSLLACLVDTANAQEAEAATRQFAAAVGFQNQKLYDLASDEWQTFLKKFPDDPRQDKAQHYLGTCLLQEKKYELAIKAFGTVVTKYPKFEQLDQSMVNLGIAQYGQAQASKKTTDYAKAERTLRTFQGQFPKSPLVARALYYRGESLYQQEQLDGAAAAYAELVRKFPKNDLAADASYALGVTQEAHGQSRSNVCQLHETLPRQPAHYGSPDAPGRDAVCNRRFCQSQTTLRTGRC